MQTLSFVTTKTWSVCFGLQEILEEVKTNEKDSVEVYEKIDDAINYARIKYFTKYNQWLDENDNQVFGYVNMLLFPDLYLFVKSN